MRKIILFFSLTDAFYFMIETFINFYNIIIL